MINKGRASIRLFLFALGSMFYIIRYLLKAIFLGIDLDRALRLRIEWFHWINKILGVELETFGTKPEESGLIVCNHRSYFDPIILLSQLIALPVGKAEVRNWPIIGYGAYLSGAIFLERRTKEGRIKARKDILDTLQKGYSVINYPEGTTHTLAQTIDFKPGMFKDAAKLNFAIYPVAIEYQKTDDAWIGDDTFIRHFFECFGKRNTNIRISYGPKTRAESAEELILQSKTWLDKELTALRKDWHEQEVKKEDSHETPMV